MRMIFCFILLFVPIPLVYCITCYECNAVQGRQCSYTATSCQYGFFGCVKIAIYSGGVDKRGMWDDQDRAIVSMIRGCAIFPLGGADICEQTSILGYRIVKCVCFNDYCNSSKNLMQLFYVPLLSALMFTLNL